MKYWLFSILTAALAYCFGSLDTMVIASNFVFRTNLRRFGRSSVWLSNFRRLYGWKGFLKLAVVELVKDAIPLLIAGWLFKSGDNAVVGRALAAFCLLLGRMYPLINRFRGGYAAATLCVSAFFINFSMGAAVLLAVGVVALATRYLAMGTLAGAAALVATAILVLDNDLASRLCIFIGLLVLVRLLGAIARISAHKEPRLSFEQDITYKFDEKL